MIKNVETLLIFAGGLGTRFSEKTKKIPKPLVLLNGKPLIHHIIDHYSEYGYKKIIILSGYKSSKFDKYFKKVSLKRNKNIYTINNNVEVHNLFTGIDSLTSTRLYKGLKYIDKSMSTYNRTGLTLASIMHLDYHFTPDSPKFVDTSHFFPTFL